MKRSTTIAGGFSLLESPRWRDGELYVSDFFTNTVWRTRKPADPSTWIVAGRVEGQPSGLGFMAGRLVTVSMLRRQVLDAETGGLVADLSQILPSPANDMCVDSSGRAYVGTFGTSGLSSTSIRPAPLLSVEPRGEVGIAADDLIFPNGIALSPDETLLYVAETYAGRVTRFDRSSNGSLSNRTTFAVFGSGAPVATTEEGDAQLPWLPDGLAVDSTGAVWVADAKGTEVRRFAADGRLLDSVSTAPLSSYAVCIGGEFESDLFICCAPPNGTFDPTVQRASVLNRAPSGIGSVR